MAIEQAKKQPREVAAFQSLRPVRVDAAATWGAQIGLNLLLPNGQVGTLAQLQALFGGGGGLVSDTEDLLPGTTDDLPQGMINRYFPEAPEDGKLYGRKDGGYTEIPASDSSTGALGCTFDGGGASIAVGSECDVLVPFGWTIVGATILADVSGSIVIDVFSDVYGNYPPTSADKITGSSPPTISSNTKSQDNTLTGWTTTGSAGVTFRFHVTSCATITRATLILKVTKS